MPGFETEGKMACPEEAKKWIRKKSERRGNSRWSKMGRWIFGCLGDLSKYHYQGLSGQPLPLLIWLWRIKAWLPVIVCRCPTPEVLYVGKFYKHQLYEQTKLVSMGWISTLGWVALHVSSVCCFCWPQKESRWPAQMWTSCTADILRYAHMSQFSSIAYLTVLKCYGMRSNQWVPNKNTCV